ncbi:hypothetical protein BAUCODRAFT_36213 [Baudoinia panamericana UAMH 10762]|uniref:Uncharacterized protein n=1 Tax=Baudoinia panamericana (strain UAMH 10762) TaxID=717646 RepID=M2MB94_BAUPA|nr:uncharacterized protein BAUCODRAFT_36213 [Baudoinia panamericana UAMH 10762]EMC93761.1 hypothetical protein BAUCODRAFT_36213 [Baudoinia panamericana UAMH 10762]
MQAILAARPWLRPLVQTSRCNQLALIPPPGPYYPSICHEQSVVACDTTRFSWW